LIVVLQKLLKTHAGSFLLIGLQLLFYVLFTVERPVKFRACDVSSAAVSLAATAAAATRQKNPFLPNKITKLSSGARIRKLTSTQTHTHSPPAAAALGCRIYYRYT